MIGCLQKQKILKTYYFKLYGKYLLGDRWNYLVYLDVTFLHGVELKRKSRICLINGGETGPALRVFEKDEVLKKA